MSSIEQQDNWATRAVSLWVNNDEGLYYMLNEWGDECMEEAEADSLVEAGLIGQRESAGIALGDRLEELFNETAPELPAGIHSDLLTAALGFVDWRRIGQDWMAE